MANFQDTWRGGGTGRGAYTLASRSTSQVPLTIQLYTGQVANSLEIKNALGTTIFSVDPVGNVEYTGSETITDALTVTGATHLMSTLQVDGVSTLTGAILAGASMSIGTTLAVTGETTLTGKLNINNLIEFDSNTTFTPENYQIGRVTGTEFLQYNVPLAKQHVWTVGDTIHMSLSSSTFSVSNSSIFGGTVTINGALNVTGLATLGGGTIFPLIDLHLNDDVDITFGNTLVAPDARLGWNTAQTVDALYLALATGQNTLIIAENGDVAYDFAHGAQTNPTIFIQSATQSATQWGSLTHNQTDFLLTSGAGAVRFAPATNVTSTLPATGKVFIDGTTTRTGTTELLDIDATIDTTTITNDVTCVTITADRAALDTGGTNGQYVQITTGDMANGEFSFCYGGKTITSACATATSNSAVFFADAPTADAQCNDYAVYISGGYDYAWYSVNGLVTFALAAANTITIDAGTVDHTGAQVLAFDVDVNSANVNALGMDIDVGTALSAGEIVNGIAIDIDGLAGDDAASIMNGIALTSANATGGVNTAINIAGTWDSGILNIAGTTTLPSYSWNGDPDTGIYNAGTNIIYFTTGGTTNVSMGGTYNLYSNIITARNTDTSMSVWGNEANDATAVGVKIGNVTQLTTAGGQIAAFYTDTGTTKVAYIDYLGGLNIAQVATTSGTPRSVVYILSGAHTGITAATEAIGAFYNYGVTKTWAAGAGPLTNQREVYIQAPTYAGAAATPLTISDAYTFYVNGPPTQGANMTLTRTWAAGFVGNIGVGAGTASLPAYSFVGDPDTGIYNTTDTILFATNGTARASINVTAFAISPPLWSLSATGTITIQSRTDFTIGANHNAVTISPGWTAENFNHTALNISATQNGANTQYLTGLDISLTKATEATTLAAAASIQVNNLTLTAGTVTNQYGLLINSLSGATNNFGIVSTANNLYFSFGAANTFSLATTVTHNALTNIVNLSGSWGNVNTGTVAGFTSSVTSGGMTTAGNAIIGYSSTVVTSAADAANTSMIGYLASVTDNAGSQNTVAFATNTGFDIDFGTIGHAMIIAPLTTAAGNGFNVSIYGSAASGAGPANGGIVTIYGGLKAGAGNDGYVKIGQGAITPTLTLDDDMLAVVGSIELGSQIRFNTTTGTSVIDTASSAGVARAIHFDIPIGAGGAADAAIDYQFKLDNVLEAGLLAETSGGGTYQNPVWKIPYMTGDYGAAWATYTAPAPASLVNGSMVVAYNSNAGALNSRLYIYSNSAWVSVALT